MTVEVVEMVNTTSLALGVGLLLIGVYCYFVFKNMDWFNLEGKGRGGKW